jgi:3-hydroxyacyl-[acyl-carrier-protein] dehydratase
VRWPECCDSAPLQILIAHPPKPEYIKRLYVSQPLGWQDSMRFCLLDQITELSPGQGITAVKNVSMAEEYLADHFPGFPVLPGVLMLEAMIQAGAWLIRATEDFAHSTILLQEARNVKFASFVEPGRQLVVSANILENGLSETRLRCAGTVDGAATGSARLVLRRFNLGDHNAEMTATDELLVQRLRELFAVLWNPSAAPAETGTG